MRLILLSICVFLAACATVPERVKRGVKEETLPLTWTDKTQGKTEGATIFRTAYGDIPKGVSMSEVMSIFGQPYAISSQRESEIWSYDFGSNERIFVYFIKGKTVSVKAK